ncbi:MAG: GNAT family N-acetyltransferase [Alphaproteobacteria bacterium]
MTGARPSFDIRDAAAADIPVLAEIYAHYVLNSIATFEEVPPDADEMETRFRRVTGGGLPWLVLESAGRVHGYAYAAPYRDRSAYRFLVEDSIYVDPASTGHGYGTALLGALIDRCTALGKRQMIAVIGGSTTAPSIGLHSRLGFRVAGVVPSAGFKLGKWADTVLMTRPLGEGDTTAPG